VLVLRRVTVSRFNSRCHTFISVCNQPTTQGQLSQDTILDKILAHSGLCKGAKVVIIIINIR